MPEDMSNAASDDKRRPPKIPEEYTIEDLAQKHRVPGWAIAGLKAAYNWGQGKTLTEAQFLKQRDDWLKRPMGGVK